MKDRNGKDLHVGDAVRWGSGINLVRGTVREIRPNVYKPGTEECRADNGNPTNDDNKTNGWTVLATLPSNAVTKMRDALTPEEMEGRERAELERLLKKYPPRKPGNRPSVSE